jgi:hypothetical protein
MNHRELENAFAESLSPEALAIWNGTIREEQEVFLSMARESGIGEAVLDFEEACKEGPNV